jgi:hypothetical protein
MTHEDVRVTPDMVADILQLNSIFIYALIDPGVIHSFLASKIVGKLWEKPRKVEKRFTIRIILGENIDIDNVYKGVKVNINRCEMRVNLIPLELHDFDVNIRYGLVRYVIT